MPTSPDGLDARIAGLHLVDGFPGNTLAGRRVLVTGAGGHIGSVVASIAAAAGCQVLATSLRAERMRLPPGVDTVAADLTDPSAAFALLEGVDIILHLAGSTHRAQKPAEVETDRRINLGAVENLINGIARRRERVVMIVAGSETQHAQAGDVLDDGTPDAPATPYDRHKCRMEDCLFAATATGYAIGVSLRLPTVFGGGVAVGAEGRGVVAHMIGRAWRGEDLQVFDGGEYRRNFLHVEDAARAFLLAASHANRLAGRHFLAGADVSHRVVDVARLVREAVHRQGGPRVDVLRVPMPPGYGEVERRDVRINSARLRREAGWRPFLTLDDQIDDVASDIGARMNQISM